MERLAEGAAKKAGMIISISRHNGMQMPLADPLVVASLVDDGGELVPYELLCRAGHDAKGKPTFEPLTSSSVCTLLAQEGSARDALYASTIKVLGAAMAV